MDEYPKTVLEMRDGFATEELCRNYLEKLRWPKGPRCPKCQGSEVWVMRPPFYRCRPCGYDFTVTVGTLFAATRKPLRLWFEALWHVTNQKSVVSALGLQRALGLGSYRTAWSWLHKLRRAMVRPGRDRLAGVVEVDETFVGGEAVGTFGRGAAGKSVVVIAAEIAGQRLGRIRLCRVANAAAASLQGALKHMVEPGAEIQTDAWRGYASLKHWGYTHRVVRATRDDELPLPHVHRVASLLKRWLLGTHQGAVAPDHLDFYLDEYTFRFNRRAANSRGLLFYRLLQQAVAIGPVRHQQIIRGRPFPPLPLQGEQSA